MLAGLHVAHCMALMPTLAVILLLRYYPEWYIVDAFGILVCAGISALFGVSMTTLPALLLLLVLAVYDAISVYKTRHMVSLAEGVINIKAPLLFVVPKSRDYSFRKDQMAVSAKAKGKGRLFPGPGGCHHSHRTGDLCQLVPPSRRQSLGVNLPAIGAMLGTYAGFLLS